MTIISILTINILFILTLYSVLFRPSFMISVLRHLLIKYLVAPLIIYRIFQNRTTIGIFVLITQAEIKVTQKPDYTFPKFFGNEY